MNSLYFLAFFLLLDSIWLFYIWTTDFDKQIISPKYISSSYNEKFKIKFKSRVLSSISPLLFKFFPSSQSVITTHTGDIPIGVSSMITQLEKENKYNNSLLIQSDIANDKINSIYDIFIDEFKKNLFILKIHTNYNFYSDNSVVSLYSISVNNFIINSRDQYDLTKSCLNKLWETKIIGVIKRYSISNDKKYLGILITQNIENNMKTLINLINLENIILNNNTNKTNENETYSNNFTEKNNDIEKIIIDGNLPINNIDVSKNVIVISRESKEFVDILLKNETTNEWKEININKYFYNKYINNTTNSTITNSTLINLTKNDSLLNNNTDNILNKNSYQKHPYEIYPIIYFNRINSFKILSNNNSDIEIIELYLTIKSKGIYINSIIINLNKANISDFDNIIIKKRKLLSNRLDKEKPENIGKNISYIYDIKAFLSKLKIDYFHKSIFSKNILTKDNLINFEYFHSELRYLNLRTYEIGHISTLSSKIHSINSDSNDHNLLVTDVNGKMFLLNKKIGNLEYDEDYKEIILGNIPNNYQNNKILASYLESFEGNITRLFILVDSGVLLCFDLTKIIRKLNRNVISVFISDFFYTIIIIIFNIGVIIFTL